MHQELSWPLGYVVELVGFDVFRDVATDEPHFVAVDPSLGLIQRHLPGAEALYFAPHQRDAALQRVGNFIFVSGAPVVGHHPLHGLFAWLG